MRQLRLALCNARPDRLLRLALCQIELTDGRPPEWVQLVPSGPKIKALDGREFANKTPQAIVDAFDADPRDLPIDWEHAQEVKAPEGEQAPASGWVVEMEVREGAVWGKVEWTPKGIASLESREYRYLSPAFLFDKVKNIIQLISAGLVNRPAFDMPALANADDQGTENDMDPKLLEILGLKEDATPAQILEAVTELKDAKEPKEPAAELEEVKTELDAARADLKAKETELANARNAHPDLSKYVPRADHDAVVARAKKLEDEKKDTAKTAHDKEVETEIDAALKAGKITPASKDFYVATCAQDGGLEKFREFLKTAPKIAEPTDLDNKPPPGGGVALSSAELEVIKEMGLTEEQYRAAAPDAQ